MITINSLTTFLGWCTIINLAIFLLSTIVVSTMQESISRIHSNIFGLDQSSLPKLYFQYLGNYKIAIFMLNLAPYIALKAMQ